MALLLAVLVVALASSPPAAQAQTQTEVWSATLTVRNLVSGILGCSNSVALDECSSTSILSDDDFTHASTDYEIDQLFVRPNGQLQIEFDTTIATGSENLILDVAGTEFAFDDADVKGGAYRQWNDSGLSWSVGDTIAVKLLEPSTDSGTVTLVSNTGQSITAGNLVLHSLGQRFRTGGNAAGYNLASVGIALRSLGTDSNVANTATVTLRKSTSGGRPGDVVYTFTSPTLAANSVNTFTAPDGAVLSANTNYIVVIEETGGSVSVGRTGTAEDAGAATGFSIANERLTCSSPCTSLGHRSKRDLRDPRQRQPRQQPADLGGQDGHRRGQQLHLLGVGLSVRGLGRRHAG